MSSVIADLAGLTQRGPVAFVVCEKKFITKRGSETAHVVFCHSGAVPNSLEWFDVTSMSHYDREFQNLTQLRVSSSHKYECKFVAWILPMLKYNGWKILHLDIFQFDQYRHNLANYHAKVEEVLPPLIPIKDGK